ncbi:MAG: hypothetical protein WBD31_00230 [Rubripirellula sp.]
MYNSSPNGATSTAVFYRSIATAIGGHPHRQYWRESGTDRVLSVPAVTLVMVDGVVLSVDTETQQPLMDGDHDYIGWLPEGHDPRATCYGMVPRDTVITGVDVSAPGCSGGAA